VSIYTAGHPIENIKKMKYGKELKIDNVFFKNPFIGNIGNLSAIYRQF
jgi:hypothetical protein